MGTENMYITTAQADSLYYDFCNKMADIFGFDEYLLILKGAAMANSATPPIGYLFTGQTAKVTKTKDGYKYDGSPIMVQYIFPYMIFDPNYSDGEIMAICLHEIGHNFSHKASTIVNLKNILLIPIVILQLLLGLLLNPIGGLIQMMTFTNAGRKIYKSIIDDMEGNETLALVVSLVKFLSALPDTITANINSIKNRFLLLNPNTLLYNFFIRLLSQGIIGYPAGLVDERIADNFATVYGYGPELSSALHKLSKSPVDSIKLVHKVPVAGWIYDLMSIPQTWILGLSDVHPMNSSRRRAQINYLKAEMKKDGISPKLQKQIEEDLKTFDKDIDNIEKQAIKLGGSAVMDKYAVLMSKIQKGDDPRELLFNAEKDVQRMDRLGEASYMNILDDVDLI